MAVCLIHRYRGLAVLVRSYRSAVWRMTAPLLQIYCVLHMHQ
jgi:hypothetical protein